MITEERKKELIKIAEDIKKGDILSNLNLTEEGFEYAFALMFLCMQEEQKNKLIERLGDTGVIYQYTKLAKTYAGNIPQFYSFEVLDAEEGSFMLTELKKISDVQEN